MHALFRHCSRIAWDASHRRCALVRHCCGSICQFVNLSDWDVSHYHGGSHLVYTLSSTDVTFACMSFCHVCIMRLWKTFGRFLWDHLSDQQFLRLNNIFVHSHVTLCAFIKSLNSVLLISWSLSYVSCGYDKTSTLHVQNSKYKTTTNTTVWDKLSQCNSLISRSKQQML